MSKRENELDGPNGAIAAFSRDDFHPSVGSEGLEIASIRAEAPRDVCEKVQEILTQAGFATSGIKERQEKDGTFRFYFVSQVSEFRERHGLSTPPSQTTEPKIESEIAKRLASRHAARLGKEAPIVEAEADFRKCVAALSYPGDFDTALVNHDERKFLCEQDGDNWVMMVLSRGTTRRGSFRQMSQQILDGLMQVPLRGSRREVKYDGGDQVEDTGGRCEARIILKPEHRDQLDELWTKAFLARQTFRRANPGAQLPAEARW